MLTASSAISTCNALRSASEKTATVLMPIFFAELMTRHAISPRFAIRILSNTCKPSCLWSFSIKAGCCHASATGSPVAYPATWQMTGKRVFGLHGAQ